MDKMFDDYKNRKMSIEEIRPLDKGDMNNLVIKDTVSDISYEVNCNTTLDDIREHADINSLDTRGFLEKVREIEGEPIHIEIEAEAKKTEYIVDTLPKDSTFKYIDTYNDNEYIFSEDEMVFKSEAGSIMVNFAGNVESVILDDVEAYQIEELFDEAAQFNEILSERGFMPDCSYSLDEDKSDRLLELEEKSYDKYNDDIEY